MLAKALQGATATADRLYIESVFSTFLYTGNGSTQTITNGIDLSGKGGLVWIKERAGAGFQHILVDTVRGATKFLQSNSTAAESTAVNTVPSFSSTGFTAGTDNQVNLSGSTFASWTFRKAAKFFDVVSYTGSGANRTIAHNLGSVPGCMIIKATSGTAQDWSVYHRSLSNTQGIALNATAAAYTATTLWNSTTPTSSVFTVGTDTTVNANGVTYVAYLFAHDAGGFGDSGNESVIQCGSFTTPPSGLFGGLNLGWEPQWFLVKSASNTGTWQIYDTMRGWTYSTDTKYLEANSSGTELPQNGLFFSPSATGIAESTSNWFAGGQTYIYIAIRRGPMKTPTDATKVFSANTWTGTGATQQITTGFFPDACLAINRNKQATLSNWLFDNLRGANKQSYTDDTAAEGADSGKAFTMTGLSNNSGNLNSTVGSATYVGEFFRRAPGFFDVVAYTGTGVARTVSHNLGVVPELMIVKRRDTTADWQVYAGAAGEYLVLNTTAAKVTSNTDRWNNTTPTSSVFSIGTNAVVNASAGTYVAYLFASVSGVSKVGSYTGTGTTQQINCGFTAGARFVLIKRTDSTGDWYVWDSARGIISGNDPYLLLNSSAAEVTNTDYIDPLNSGFEISSTAPAAINANGGSFIFLAVA